jgi:hypothetical protein
METWYCNCSTGVWKVTKGSKGWWGSLSTAKLKLEIASLAIGIGIGIAILTAIVILYVLPLGKGVYLDFEDAALSTEDNAQFWMFGLIKAINPQVMTLDQTIGDPGLQGGTNNPAVHVRLDKGAVFVNCREGAEGRHTPEECSKTLTQDKLAKGVHVCALVSTFGDGALYAGKIWIDRVCSHSEPVQSSLTAEGITLSAPYLVEISWNLYETIYGNNSDLSISIKDKETMEPLKQVIFNFGYKGIAELGGFQDRYIEDFSNPDKFRTGIKNPCDMHLTIFIDKVGDQSFASLDLDTSSVGIQFRTFPENELEQCDSNNIKLSLFNGYDLSGNRVP